MFSNFPMSNFQRGFSMIKDDTLYDDLPGTLGYLAWGVYTSQLGKPYTHLHHATLGVDTGFWDWANFNFRRALTVHEVGHGFGFGHPPMSTHSIMRPYIDSTGNTNRFTPTDLKGLWAKYGEMNKPIEEFKVDYNENLKENFPSRYPQDKITEEQVVRVNAVDEPRPDFVAAMQSHSNQIEAAAYGAQNAKNQTIKTQQNLHNVIMFNSVRRQKVGAEKELQKVR
jgi:hypothetical protein